MKRPLKLLFVLPAYEPAWALGGIVRCMSNLCRGLASLGHEVTVYAINVDGRGSILPIPCGEVVVNGGVSTYYFPSSFGSSSFFDSRALVGKLRNTICKFDLVYVSAIWQWLGLSAAKICARHRVPLIIGPHGSFIKSLQPSLSLRKKIFWHFFLKKSLSRASALHFTTVQERRHSLDLLNNFKSFVIPNSLDCNYFRPLKKSRHPFRERYGIPSNVPLIITVGRAVVNKRIDLLIRSLSAVPEINLLIVGPEPGDVRRQWEDLAEKLQLSRRIFWAGYLQGEELLAAYSAADIFSLISSGENFGMVVVEAMACGLPVLLNPEIGVCDELRNKQGVLVVDQDSDRIGDALTYFVRHRLSWASWRKNCRQVAKEIFAHDKVAGLMTQACEDVLTGNFAPACRWVIPARC
jgi:glycosyltransferase involved in cell wall biosynthesis